MAVVVEAAVIRAFLLQDRVGQVAEVQAVLMEVQLLEQQILAVVVVVLVTQIKQTALLVVLVSSSFATLYKRKSKCHAN
jgi:hypothetical protein